MNHDEYLYAIINPAEQKAVEAGEPVAYSYDFAGGAFAKLGDAIVTAFHLRDDDDLDVNLIVALDSTGEYDHEYRLEDGDWVKYPAESWQF